VATKFAAFSVAPTSLPVQCVTTGEISSKFSDLEELNLTNQYIFQRIVTRYESNPACSLEDQVASFHTVCCLLSTYEAIASTKFGNCTQHIFSFVSFQWLLIFLYAYIVVIFCVLYYVSDFSRWITCTIISINCVMTQCGHLVCCFQHETNLSACCRVKVISIQTLDMWKVKMTTVDNKAKTLKSTIGSSSPLPRIIIYAIIYKIYCD